MREKITGIVVSIVKHSDKHSVATLYTKEHGRVSCIVNASSGKRGGMRFMPLQCVGAEMSFNANKELQVLHRPEVEKWWPSLYCNPMKTSVAIFISDFLNRLLRATQPERGVWSFIERSLELYDREDELADFHIVFVASMAAFTGILPDMSGYKKGRWFDMRASSYTDFKPAHKDCLVPDESAWPLRLAKLTYLNSKGLRLNGSGRTALLNGMLKYYALHVPGMQNIQSHNVLREVFED